VDFRHRDLGLRVSSFLPGIGQVEFRRSSGRAERRFFFEGTEIEDFARQIKVW